MNNDIEKEGRKTKHAWHLVDWSMPSSVIADILGVRIQNVTTARRKYAPHTSRPIKKNEKRTCADD